MGPGEPAATAGPGWGSTAGRICAGGKWGRCGWGVPPAHLCKLLLALMALLWIFKLQNAPFPSQISTPTETKGTDPAGCAAPDPAAGGERRSPVRGRSTEHQFGGHSISSCPAAPQVGQPRALALLGFVQKEGVSSCLFLSFLLLFYFFFPLLSKRGVYIS